LAYAAHAAPPKDRDATHPSVRGVEGGAALLKDAQRFFAALPTNMAAPGFPVTPERVDLGRKLFFEPRISVDGTVSCARCHLSALYGSDGLTRSRGSHDKLNRHNAPTVLNAGLEFRAHWIGDREGLEDQAKRSLIGPLTFGNPDYPSVAAKIKAIPDYVEMFKKTFPGESDPITPDNWGTAIGAYERTLVTPSRFDDYLAGDAVALSAPERAGLRKFIDGGCAGCHNGSAVGGGKFEKFGVSQDYWKETGSPEVDKGRFEVTHAATDLYVFKVPGLRNVAMTPPYFHDGSVTSLEQAVRIMAKVQLGTTLTTQDAQDIVAFLESLTGRLPKQFSESPVLRPAAFDRINDTRPVTPR